MGMPAIRIEEYYAKHCPVCGCLVEDEPIVCEKCETVHHSDCWEYAGGCAIFGCRVSERRLKAIARAGNVLSEDLYNWRNSYKLQWFACATMVLSHVLSTMTNTWSWTYAWQTGMGHGSFSSCLALLSMSGVFNVVTVIALFAYLFLIYPTMKLRWRLEEHMGTSLAPTQRKSEIIDSILQLSPKKRVMLRMLSIARPVAIIVCLVSLFAILYGPLAKFGLIYRLTKYHVFELLITFFVASGLVIASRNRLVYFETLRNRLEATLSYGNYLEKVSSGDL